MGHRMKFLSKYFDQEKSYLTAFLMSKKSKKSKSLIKKLTSISDEVRSLLLNIYLKR